MPNINVNISFSKVTVQVLNLMWLLYPLLIMYPILLCPEDCQTPNNFNFDKTDYAGLAADTMHTDWSSIFIL